MCAGRRSSDQGVGRGVTECNWSGFRALWWENKTCFSNLPQGLGCGQTCSDPGKLHNLLLLHLVSAQTHTYTEELQGSWSKGNHCLYSHTCVPEIWSHPTQVIPFSSMEAMHFLENIALGALGSEEASVNPVFTADCPHYITAGDVHCIPAASPGRGECCQGMALVATGASREDTLLRGFFLGWLTRPSFMPQVWCLYTRHLFHRQALYEQEKALETCATHPDCWFNFHLPSRRIDR